MHNLNMEGNLRILETAFLRNFYMIEEGLSALARS